MAQHSYATGVSLRKPFQRFDMFFERKSLYQSLIDWIAHLGVLLHAALSTATEQDDANTNADRGIDRDFDGWLHGDASVTKNPTSRYGDRTPGYITSNGLGSMEIGAADD
jgi:hypothetical protein